MILLDIMMPGENGFEVMKQLKNSAATAHIPTICLTVKTGSGSVGYWKTR